MIASIESSFRRCGFFFFLFSFFETARNDYSIVACDFIYTENSENRTSEIAACDLGNRNLRNTSQFYSGFTKAKIVQYSFHDLLIRGQITKFAQHALTM